MQHGPAQPCPERQERSGSLPTVACNQVFTERSTAVPIGEHSTKRTCRRCLRPGLGFSSLAPSVLLRLSGTRHRSQVGWRGLNFSNLGAPASRPASAARGPMKRRRQRRDPVAFYCISPRCNGLEVDEVAACGLPVAVTMPGSGTPVADRGNTATSVTYSTASAPLPR